MPCELRYLLEKKGHSINEFTASDVVYIITCLSVHVTACVHKDCDGSYLGAPPCVDKDLFVLICSNVFLSIDPPLFFSFRQRRDA